MSAAMQGRRPSGTPKDGLQAMQTIGEFTVRPGSGGNPSMHHVSTAGTRPGTSLRPGSGATWATTWSKPPSAARPKSRPKSKPRLSNGMFDPDIVRSSMPPKQKPASTSSRSLPQLPQVAHVQMAQTASVAFFPSQQASSSLEKERMRRSEAEGFRQKAVAEDSIWHRHQCHGEPLPVPVVHESHQHRSARKSTSCPFSDLRRKAILLGAVEGMKRERKSPTLGEMQKWLMRNGWPLREVEVLIELCAADPSWLNIELTAGPSQQVNDILPDVVEVQQSRPMVASYWRLQSKIKDHADKRGLSLTQDRWLNQKECWCGGRPKGGGLGVRERRSGSDLSPSSGVRGSVDVFT
eukprot:gnl/TRDRNA2_/TRDRNA2_195872_c0_seq1.p1 gnl/TRDRNA2_/TRDRNA2_195872_c0~~gnl/TRDRNA2_/TRDRNA2_195872_c0_seq1.p1  ORF type:complete len:351 (+),score=38.68 gnl/TRDRNA2_/TRDRNA2_195872_c0_seq1:74-1126(+)